MAAWILGSSRRNDIRGTHVIHWLSVPPCVVLICLWNLGVKSVSMLQNSCGPLLNLHNSELISKSQTKTIHMPMRYSGQLLTILALAFTFCNNHFHSIYVCNTQSKDCIHLVVLSGSRTVE